MWLLGSIAREGGTVPEQKRAQPKTSAKTLQQKPTTIVLSILMALAPCIHYPTPPFPSLSLHFLFAFVATFVNPLPPQAATIYTALFLWAKQNTCFVLSFPWLIYTTSCVCLLSEMAGLSFKQLAAA